MAQQCGAPIVPVVVSNVKAVYDSRIWLFKRGVIKLRVLEPISTVGMTKEDVNALVESVQTKLVETYIVILGFSFR